MTVVDENFFEEPIYWDDAARIAVQDILRFLAFHDGSSTLENIRALLDYIIVNNPISRPENWMAVGSMIQSWQLLGATAIAVAEKNEIIGINTAGAAEEELEIFGEKLANLVIRKQRDYGSDNIMRFGRFGLIVRMHDKVARLENLTSRQLSPNHESIQDNYMDVVGYSIVAILLERGWFTLPLRPVE